MSAIISVQKLEKRRFYGLAFFYGLACGLTSVWLMYRNLFMLGYDTPITLQILSFAGVVAAVLCFFKPKIGWYGLLAVGFCGFLSAAGSMNGPSLAANGFALTMIWSSPPRQKIADQFNVDKIDIG